MVAGTLTDKRRRAGRLGGLQTYFRHGRQHFVDAGRKGGLNHPRAITYEKDIQPLELKKIEQIKRRKRKLDKLVATGNLSLPIIRKLWRQKIADMEVARAKNRDESQPYSNSTATIAVEGTVAGG